MNDQSIVVPAPPKKRTAVHQTMSSQPLKLYMAEHDLNQQAMGEILGVHASTIGNYLSVGKMPRYMGIAIEGLQRRMRATPEVVLIVKPKAKRDVVIATLKAMDVEFTTL